MTQALALISVTPEERAILAVSSGAHPGNFFSSPILGGKNDPDVVENVAAFFSDIPADWHAFRRVTRHWLLDQGYPDPAPESSSRGFSAVVTFTCPWCASTSKIDLDLGSSGIRKFSVTALKHRV